MTQNSFIGFSCLFDMVEIILHYKPPIINTLMTQAAIIKIKIQISHLELGP